MYLSLLDQLQRQSQQVCDSSKFCYTIYKFITYIPLYYGILLS